ncbi:MAG: heavy metal translocating P-type ATPase [Deltaproteobacteria bacterium]|nr:heavy metal translocating P-type ATPase [Deltaproteobacteria bacterium]
MTQACSVCGQLHCPEHQTAAPAAKITAAIRPAPAAPPGGPGSEDGAFSADGDDPPASGSREAMTAPPGRRAPAGIGLVVPMAAPAREDSRADARSTTSAEDPVGEDGCACCGKVREAAPLVARDGDAAPAAHDSPLTRLLVASGLALGSETAHFASLPEWLVLALAAAAVATGGLGTWLAGWKSIAKKQLDILALMSVAVTGAVLIGEFAEAALVTVLFTLAETLEDRSVSRARKAIASLLQLAPEMAWVRDADGSWAERKASDVPAGALVRVRPGEKLSLDGVVASGGSAVDQSPITGESVPVEKSPGDKVFAGTMNVTGTLDYEVSAAYGDSALSRIVKTVEEAENSKAPVERFVEKFAGIYTPAVFALAVLAAVVPPLLLGGVWTDWIYRALALLVISCPCALVVSTPVAVLSALATATKAGLLVKGGVFLEEGRRLAVVAMDKTGTLTSGKFSRTDFIPAGGYDPALADLLAGSLASLSRHPVSLAVAEASEAKGNFAELSDFADLPGRGVSASHDGRAIALGSRGLMESLGALDDGSRELLAKLEAQGKSVVGLSDDGKLAAVIACADTVKVESRLAVAELRELGVRTVMLTGDNAPAAEMVASIVGVDETVSSLMPEEKLAYIEKLGRNGDKVGMVGDGINDAPALARADIGFSMGAAGTGAAIETADVAIMDDNLAKIPSFIRLSRAVRRIFIQNIVFILLVKLVFIAVTLAGHTAMWMAVFADIGVCLIVMANSLRLTHKK